MADDKIPNGTTNGEADQMLGHETAKNGDVKMYKFTKEGDVETGAQDFDPFKARQVEHPVTDTATLTHLLKASLGTGILSMPAAFKASGLVMGIFLTVLLSLICTHCAYILVECAHVLYRKSGKTAMGFSDVAEQSCLRGPKWARKYAPWAKYIVLWGIFVTYFATCSCYAVIIAKNFNFVLYEHMEKFDERITIALLLVPLVLLAYVPNLKYLAPVSMVANGFMAIGLGITFYYIVIGLPTISNLPEDVPLVGNIGGYPTSIAIVIFAIEAIGVVMPLENNMKTPQHFVGICGVLNQGMSGVTLVYIILGFFGFMRYGGATADSITHNLPHEAYLAQSVNILIGLAVFCTFGLQFYVCLDIAWRQLEHRFTKRPTVANYVMRTVLVVICVAIAVAVPKIVPFVSLIGAFCFSILGLMVPIMIEVLTFWDKGFGRYNWKIVKNVVVILTGMLALFFGSKDAIGEILK